MAKCCFCGLCTVVCPTECLVMTSEYDYSTQKISEMTFHWRDIEPEEAIKKQKEWEEYELAKKQAKLNAIASEEKSKSENNEKKPVFKIKPKTNHSNSTNEIK
jgi:formate hydrogenlyase subunit 6/NADH:ubiquinone oxidoreductase subunit I